MAINNKQNKNNEHIFIISYMSIKYICMWNDSG